MNIIKSKKQAELVKLKAIEITADVMKDEFESFFADDLENAYAKLQEVTNKMSEDMLNTTLLKDNRLYLYEILMDNSSDEIIEDLDKLIKSGGIEK